jgi:SAM-dependent methyltransferase
MNQYYWDTKIDYLIGTRYLYFNDDYLKFLVTEVWGFVEPVHIIDFGCGTGFIGLKFLPLLPAGSSYTGIDKGELLIQKAEDFFASLPYKAKFILGDINEIELDEGIYDVATCQALLLHMEDPKSILRKMIRSIKPGGKVISIEPHRNACQANQYIDSLTIDQVSNPGILQKLRELDRVRTGKDGNIGIKLPIYMRELGLQEIGCRISDRVNHLHPDLPDDEKVRLYNLFRTEAFGTGVVDEEDFITSLVDRGLMEDEACKELHIEKFLGDWFSENGMHHDSICAPSMMVSYGTKVR